MNNTHGVLGHEQEGVIKYQLQFYEQALSNDFVSQYLSFTTLNDISDALNSSRNLLKDKGLIGQDSLRYGGDGFGNISARADKQAFLISGSQTGHLDVLSHDNLALVESFDIYRNQLTAYGLAKPSSESMTHGVCYQASRDINAVIHVHSPDIWQACDILNLPFTDSLTPYGTPQMAEAVIELLETHHDADQTTIFAMKGHQDGIVAVGESLDSCTSSLLTCLHQSILLKGYSQ